MEPVFRKEYKIDAIHLDCYGRTKPSVLLFFAQEVAGQHCTELALDWDTLSGRRMFWAVIRNRVQISRLPVAGESITVETWPMPTTRTAYPRSTIAYDEQGSEVFRAISLWVLMDMDSRGMILPGKSGVEVCGTLRGNELAAPASIVPKVLKTQVHRRVSYTDLDRNGHMNNTRYLDWIDDLLPSGFHAGHPIREFTICYLSEAVEGQDLQIHWELSEGSCLQVDALRQRTDVSEKQERVFSAQIHF